MASILDLQQRFLRTAGDILIREVAARVASRSIRQSLSLQVRPESVSVRTPYYWARIYHDGRRAVNARPGRWLAFYPNPSLDPRLARGRPVRYSEAQRLRLDPSVFRADVRAGRLILTKHVAAQSGTFFFRRAGEALKPQVRGVAKKEFDDATRDFFKTLPKLGGVINVTPGASVR